MTNSQRFLDTFFNAKVMARYLPDILAGMVVTVELAVLVILTGLAAGLALALLRALAIRPLNWAIIFVVDLFRALPPLVIIVLFYFGLPSLGLTPSGFICTWMSLALVLMAFSEEIPPLTNRTIAITKSTALGSVVAVTEILGQASSAVSNSYNPSPLTMAAAAYLAIFLPVVLLGRWVETRFAWKK